MQSGILTFLLAMVPFLSGQLSAQTAVTGWEYWFDTDINGRIYTALGLNQVETIESPIDVTSLAYGLHILNYRFHDENGLWSATVRKPFVRNDYGEPFPSFIKSELWIDGRPVESFSQEIYSVNNYSLESLEEVAALTDGLHRVSFRVMDGAGRWSVPIARLFRKYSVPPGVTDLRKFQIWFDSDMDVHPWTTGVSPQMNIELNGEMSFLSDGLHRIYFRAADIYGRWSSVYSKLFIKRTSQVNGSDIVSYQYWVDDAASGVTTVSTTDPGDIITLISGIDFSSYGVGEHNFYIRFLDSAGRWSVPVADTLDRLSFLKAVFENNVSEGCVELEVTFANSSTDASAYKWYFGDGSSSVEANPNHTYVTPGEYEVALVAYDVDAGLSDSVFTAQAVTVHPLPQPDLGEDISNSPEGVPVVLDPGLFASYLWSDNSTEPTLTITENGDYSVEVTDANGCVNTDIITISFATAIDLFGSGLETRIWPNPLFGDILKMELSEITGNSLEVKILNMEGKVIISNNIAVGDDRLIDLDLSGLSAGNYIILFRNGDRYGSARLVVAK